MSKPAKADLDGAGLQSVTTDWGYGFRARPMATPQTYAQWLRENKPAFAGFRSSYGTQTPRLTATFTCRILFSSLEPCLSFCPFIDLTKRQAT
jgi:hypothetical protein